MRILIIEDEKDIIDFLKTSLEEECFAVDCATDGERGSFLARSGNYDLIILDNALPKKEGITVCEEIRRSGKSTPIIVLSVNSETGAKVNLLNTGADDYITKPFSLGELKARIKAILRRPEKIEGEIFQIDDLTLDTRKNSVTRGGREIGLRRKEFMLLEYMIKNRGVVLSRGAIMEHVWDMDANAFSNTIETHILNLRNKIDTRGKKKLIHTAPGRGYKIDVFQNL